MEDPMIKQLRQAPDLRRALDRLPKVEGTPGEVHVALACADGPIDRAPSAHVFDDARVAGMIASFESLLAAIVADPDQSIAALEILPPRERDKLLVHWNATELEVPAACAHELVADRARETPDAIAIDTRLDEVLGAESEVAVVPAGGHVGGDDAKQLRRRCVGMSLEDPQHAIEGDAARARG